MVVIGLKGSLLSVVWGSVRLRDLTGTLHTCDIAYWGVAGRESYDCGVVGSSGCLSVGETDRVGGRCTQLRWR